MKQYAYSEVFNSIQGEGHYTGVPTAWIRFHLCNLECNGFGQDNPTQPDTYDLPYKNVDISAIDKVEDLPVFEKGCDSSYTWAKQYRHLMKKGTVEELADSIRDTMRTDSNPEGFFQHPVSKQTSHLCFTGGEPLMPHGQQAIVGIVDTFKRQAGPDTHWGTPSCSNSPKSITIETNGTKPLSKEFVEYFGNRGSFSGDTELFFSVSPKLWTVAGEQPKKAIKPEVVKGYWDLVSNKNPMGSGQLKFVVGPKQEQWDEMESVIAEFREAGIDWPVWVMPVGATVEEQEIGAGIVAKKAFERGYNVAARVHTYLFGNAIGT